MSSGLYHSRSVRVSCGALNYRYNRSPKPLFKPQSGWNALDYYEAHALNPDPILYHRAREGQYSMEGATISEARRLHRQIYDALEDIHAYSDYLPHEIGHAAAYETYRIWTHNPSIRSRGSDHGQHRETFIAIAIAEVSHIFQTDQAHRERRKFQEACETAAATASTTFQALGDEGYSGGNRISPSPLSRPSSLPRDDFLDDRTVSHESHSRSRRSSPAPNRSQTLAPLVNGSPQESLASIPIPINNFSRESPYHPAGSQFSGLSSQHAITTYPQQYPGSVQGIPTAGSTYSPNWEFVCQTQTLIQVHSVVARPYPADAGPSFIIFPPVQQSPYHTFARGWTGYH